MRERWGSANPGWLQGMADDAREEDGIQFRWAPVYSNPLRFHALLEWAWKKNPRAQVRVSSFICSCLTCRRCMQHDLCRRIMSAYYTRGEDVTSVDALMRYVTEAGYDAAEARTYLAKPGQPSPRRSVRDLDDRCGFRLPLHAGLLEETDHLCGQVARQYRIRGVPHIVIGRSASPPALAARCTSNTASGT